MATLIKINSIFDYNENKGTIVEIPNDAGGTTLIITNLTTTEVSNNAGGTTLTVIHKE